MSEAILVKRFKHLKKKKEAKLSIMEKVEKQLQPKDTQLLERSNANPNKSEILFDVTARNVMEDYTLEGLIEIINPYECWFTLDIDRDKLGDEVREWANIAREELFVFINDSSYYKNLIEDKSYFDVYGFSGITFYKDQKLKKIRIHTEDPKHTQHLSLIHI